MKTLILVLLICMITSFVLAQESDLAKESVLTKEPVLEQEADEYQQDTLFGGSDVSYGGYGGPVIKFTSINDQFAVFMGVRGALIIDHSIAIGIAGFSLANSIEGEGAPFSGRTMNMSYIGLFFEYMLLADRVVHLSISALVGGGNVNYWDWRESKDENSPYPEDTFIVIEPELNMMINITEWFRVGLGGSYRFINLANLTGANDAGLSGFAGNLSLKFGFF